MLGRLSRGLGHKSGGRKGVKYRFDVVVEKLDNLPSPVKKCRVVWSRGPKLQMTDTKDVNKGKLCKQCSKHINLQQYNSTLTNWH